MFVPKIFFTKNLTGIGRIFWDRATGNQKEEDNQVN
jgi:hypothetical protein